MLAAVAGSAFAQVVRVLPSADSTAVRSDSARIQIPDMAETSASTRKDTTRVIYINLNDSLKTYFFVDRLNLRDQAIRSFQHDAGDFVRCNPSNFIVEYQSVPVRKTVSPFTLPGNRLNVIFNNRTISPLEHLPEPDNMINFDDIPTEAVSDIYNIEGPLGMALGGGNGTSTMILVPPQPDSMHAESKMVVDKGWSGYAYTKGTFARRDRNGRSIKLAAGYRKTDGITATSDDDAYHQWGELILPFGNKMRLNLSGRLYRREATYPIRPMISYEFFNRFRRDRDLMAGIDFGLAANRKYSVEFRHQRSESNLDRSGSVYFRNLDISNNSTKFAHERMLSGVGIKANAVISQEKYGDGSLTHKRWRGMAEINVLSGSSTTAFLTYAKIEKVGGFDPGPSLTLVSSTSNEKYYATASIGYATKFPRQYELDLTARSASLVDASVLDYFESGKASLDPEKQFTANIGIGLGRIGNDLLLSLTGGKIFDGIDWQKSDTAGLALGEFRSFNSDIEFVNISARQRLSWRSNISWSGGAAYHYIKLDDDDPPYAPDYQAFSGLELYFYLRKLDLHLYGYAEASYTDRYYGLNGDKLGNRAIASAKLSFRIKKFRFYYIFQNAPASVFQSREDYLINGRYNYYGLTWDFLD